MCLEVVRNHLWAATPKNPTLAFHHDLLLLLECLILDGELEYMLLFHQNWLTKPACPVAIDAAYYDEDQSEFAPIGVLAGDALRSKFRYILNGF